MKSFYKNQNLNLIASMAQQIVFNNSKNGKLESTNTQDAIDEISNILDKEKTMISDAWNSSTTYTVGQYCIYNNTLWKCKVQHSGQTPSEGTYWTKTQIDDEILSIKNDVSTLNSNLVKVHVKEYTVVCGNTKDSVSQMYFGTTTVSSPEGTVLARIPVAKQFSGWNSSGITVSINGTTLTASSLYSNNANIFVTVITLFI